jgi:serine/threonine-protein kinase
VVLSAVYVAAVVHDRARLRAALVEAETNATRTEQVTDFAVGLFEAQGGGAAYADSTSARELLARAVDRAHELAGQPRSGGCSPRWPHSCRSVITSARDVLTEAFGPSTPARRRSSGCDIDVDLSDRGRCGTSAVPMLREALAIRRRGGGPTCVRAMRWTRHGAHDRDYRAAKPLFDQYWPTRRAVATPTPERAAQLGTLGMIYTISRGFLRLNGCRARPSRY